MKRPGIDRLSSIEPVMAFLEPSHSELAKQIGSFCKHELSNETEPQSDKEARTAARQWLKLVGGKGVLSPLALEDLRGFCLTREAIASYSPLVDAVVAIQALVATSLQLAGSKKQQALWLDGIVTGQIMAAFAMTEPEAGSDVAAISTTATKDTNGWVLNGQKHLISNAGIADLYLVFAATSLKAGSRGLSAFLVPSNTQGLVYTGTQIAAAGHPLGQISLKDCSVPSDALLGSLNGGFKLGMMTLDRLRPSVGAAACGMASRALVESLQHVTSRRQFGEPLERFQLIREKIGRMSTLLEAARLLVYRAAWCHDHGKRITLEAAMAKSFSTEAAQSIIDEGLQIAGGLGVVVGHPLERLYRAVRALRIYEGTTEIQRLIVAGELLGSQPLGKPGQTILMKITCVGGGPAGLYFSLLMKKARPAYEVTLLERNKLEETFSAGVVLSDATINSIAAVDPEIALALSQHGVPWNDIEVHYNGNYTSSTGHGFVGIGRDRLIKILRSQAQAQGVNICFEHEEASLAVGKKADLVVAADGANSTIRSRLAAKITTTTHKGSNRFMWLETDKVFSAFTFCFRENEHGLWCIHAYQYASDRSTIIVECNEATWLSSGMKSATEAEMKTYLEQLFTQELSGHKLMTTFGTWQQFSTICTTPWSSDRFVLLGDAAHTTHFSIGSGTSMAMDDALVLCEALSSHAEVPEAFKQYEKIRRPQIESLQRSAQASMEWFEHASHYRGLDPVLFSFSLLTRSMRITHEHLRTRDPKFLAQVDTAVFENAEHQVKKPLDRTCLPPPMFTPFRLRDLVIPNRVVVSPMCQYVAKDGTVGDWHLVHLGSRALGGAGLLIAEMTNVNPDARISPNCAGLYKDDHLAAWKRVVEFVHHETPAKIGIQLGHAGRKGATKPPWEGNHEPLEENSWSILSASPLPYLPGHSKIPQEMTRGDMDQVVTDFVKATKLAILAAFDLLEIHMAHGYLLASFISPLTNKRTDEYGGSLENRMRFPLEVFDACRDVWPPHQPMSVRISAVDWAPGGMNIADAVKVAALLKAHNCDIVDVSTGQTVPEQQPNYGRLFQTPFADRIRRETNIATMAVGNISSYMDVNTIIAAGRADLCLLARAHLFDPYWTRHAAWMLDYPLPWPNPYKAMERYNPRLEFKFTDKKE